MNGLWRYGVIILAGLNLFAPSSYAQDNSIEDLLKTIFEDVGQVPQTPIYESRTFETLQIGITLPKDVELSEHFLIITATPPDPSGAKRRSQLKPLSELTLSLADINTVDMVPLTLREGWQDGHSYLMLDAQIHDINQSVVFKAEQVVIYRGHEMPNLTLISVDPDLTKAPLPDVIGVEIVKGQIELAQKDPIKRDSTLNIQLLENALAGGTSLTLAAEKKIALNNQDWPIEFELDRAIFDSAAPQDLGFKIWISDWAGRKTHVMRNAVAYQGPNIDYVIKLDSIKRGEETRRGRNLDPSLMAQSLVSGNVVYDPRFGIPSDARLKVQLTRDGGRFGETKVLSEQVMLLRGFDTRIPFSITTDSTHFDPLIPPPYLSITLTDARGEVYYGSGNVSAREGQNNTIRLNPL